MWPFPWTKGSRPVRRVLEKNQWNSLTCSKTKAPQSNCWRARYRNQRSVSGPLAEETLPRVNQIELLPLVEQRTLMWLHRELVTFVPNKDVTYLSPLAPSSFEVFTRTCKVRLGKGLQNYFGKCAKYYTETAFLPCEMCTFQPWWPAVGVWAGV